jgi:hypothetical protein
MRASSTDRSRRFGDKLDLLTYFPLFAVTALLAALACFAFVCSAWLDSVRRVPPEFVRFDVPDFSVAALLAVPIAFGFPGASVIAPFFVAAFFERPDAGLSDFALTVLFGVAIFLFSPIFSIINCNYSQARH